MLEITKNYVMDENQQPIAVQIPIADFEKIEEILENYGLLQLMEESENEERLSKDEAWKYYQYLKNKNVEN
jgi:RelB Antitoxin alpha helical domain